MTTAITDEIELILEERFEAEGVCKSRTPELIIGLESPGGSASEALKIMTMLRAYFCRIDVLIMKSAMSAAVVLALGADSIYMTPRAHLGPIDPQLWREDEGRSISALDWHDVLTERAKDAVSFGTAAAEEIRQRARLNKEQYVNAEVQLISNLFKTLSRGALDSELDQRVQRSLQEAQRYTDELRSMRRACPKRPTRMCAFSSDAPKCTAAARDTMSQTSLDELIYGYPDHEFPIMRSEAKRLGLPVIDAHDHPQWSQLREWYRQSGELELEPLP